MKTLASSTSFMLFQDSFEQVLYVNLEGIDPGGG